MTLLELSHRGAPNFCSRCQTVRLLELLRTHPATGKQFWVVDWKEAFKRTADELYRALTTSLSKVSSVSNLGSDERYWTTAANIILRIKSEMLQEKIMAANTMS